MPNHDLALRLLDLPTSVQVDLVTTMAYAARLALAAGLFPPCDLTECLSGRCEACQVREALAMVEDSP